MSNISLHARLECERLIREATVKVLLEAGYSLNVDNGGDSMELPAESRDAAEVLGVMNAADDDHLIVVGESGRRIGWVWFVYGNDGWDVISDYSVSLTDVLRPVDALVDQLDEKQWRIELGAAK